MGKLSERELKVLLQGGETNTVELKVAAPRAVEMAERLCGMANAQGGMIIIGVKDATHEIVGVPEKRIGETLDVVLRAVRQMIKPELVLDPPEPEIYTFSDKKLVIATVKPSHGPVYQAHGIYWVRRGTHTFSLGLAELLEMANDRGLVDWEHQPAHNATMDDIDKEKVNAYLAQRSSTTHRTSRFDLAPPLWRRKIFGYTVSQGEEEPWARAKRPTPPSLSEKPCDWLRRAESPSYKSPES